MKDTIYEKDFDIKNERGHFIIFLNKEQLSVEDSHEEAKQFISAYLRDLKRFIIFYEYLTKDDRWVLTHVSLEALSEEDAKIKLKSNIKKSLKIRNLDVRVIV